MPETKKVFSLNIDLDFLDNVYILGIQAPLLPVHRLAYFLNRDAQWDLTRTDDYLGAYALLQHTLPLERLNLFLLENKIPTPLVPTEDCDYFLLACGEVDHYDFKALTELIENMESIFSVYPVDIKRHETLQNFFLEDDRFPKI
ncbi:MAG: hypothetical protein K2O53_04455 [Bacteroidales bacterium]|nr:hypothetical protein [Bacteroidales bacterium]MDE6514455.1 hypothetical protein [Bacteroidales bacterium]MDE7090956.1 hypothetical protein [Bacteroidales bacterium]